MTLASVPISSILNGLRLGSSVHVQFKGGNILKFYILHFWYQLLWGYMLAYSVLEGYVHIYDGGCDLWWKAHSKGFLNMHGDFLGGFWNFWLAMEFFRVFSNSWGVLDDIWPIREIFLMILTHEGVFLAILTYWELSWAFISFDLLRDIFVISG